MLPARAFQLNAHYSDLRCGLVTSAMNLTKAEKTQGATHFMKVHEQEREIAHYGLTPASALDVEFSTF